MFIKTTYTTTPPHLDMNIEEEIFYLLPATYLSIGFLILVEQRNAADSEFSGND